jgi:hypothetical protein
MRTDRRTYRHDETNSRISQFCEGPYNLLHMCSLCVERKLNILYMHTTVNQVQPPDGDRLLYDHQIYVHACVFTLCAA